MFLSAHASDFVCKNLDLKCYLKRLYVREGRKDPNIRLKKLVYGFTVVIQSFFSFSLKGYRLMTPLFIYSFFFLTEASG